MSSDMEETASMIVNAGLAYDMRNKYRSGSKPGDWDID